MLSNLAVNNFENLTSENHGQSFKGSMKLDLLVFPKEPTGSLYKNFCLKIKPRGKTLSSLKMLVEVVSIGTLMFYAPRKRLGLWEIDFGIDEFETEIELDILSQHLFFSKKGIRREAFAIDRRNTAEERLYVVYFFLYDREQKIYNLKNCVLVNNDGQ